MQPCPIANFERKYLIYPDGTVWNLAKEAWQAQTENPNGYMKVLLSLNGVKEQLLVHRLVALHFLPNPYGHPQVNHRNGNKRHNAVTNLEWCSRSENIQHSLKTGLRQGFMSPDEKRALIKRVLAGELIRDLAVETGRGEESLSGMLRRRAEQDGRKNEWTQEMKRRRKLVAIRNIATWNTTRDPD